MWACVWNFACFKWFSGFCLLKNIAFQLPTNKTQFFADYSKSTSKSSVPNAAETAGNTEISAIDAQQKAGGIDDSVKTAVLMENIEQNPINSDTRPKGGANLLYLQLYLYSFIMLWFVRGFHSTIAFSLS